MTAPASPLQDPCFTMSVDGWVLSPPISLLSFMLDSNLSNDGSGVKEVSWVKSFYFIFFTPPIFWLLPPCIKWLVFSLLSWLVNWIHYWFKMDDIVLLLCWLFIDCLGVSLCLGSS
ncbi:hypothetical protein GQ457_17G011540 [Hibiscus cannabinus]